MRNSETGARRRGKKFVRPAGFTLLEIMITMGIILVLATMAMPKFLRTRENSQIAQAKAELEILSAAVVQLAWDTGKWPMGLDRTLSGSTECWDLRLKAAGLIAQDSMFSDWAGPYVAGIEKDPWGSDYFFDPDYRVNGKMVPVVGCFGPNKKGRNLYDRDDIFIVVKK